MAKKTNLIQIKVTLDEKNKIITTALKEGKSMTQFILDRCLYSDIQQKILFEVQNLRKEISITK